MGLGQHCITDLDRPMLLYVLTTPDLWQKQTHLICLPTMKLHGSAEAPVTFDCKTITLCDSCRAVSDQTYEPPSETSASVSRGLQLA